jgi:hypothetical protein
MQDGVNRREVRVFMRARAVACTLASFACAVSWMTGTAVAAPAAVRNPGDVTPSLSLSVGPSGQAEAATMGWDHSLRFYWSATGKTWHRTLVAGAGTTFSGPSLVAVSGGGAFIAAEGARHTLQFYRLTAGRWHRTQIGGDGSAYGAPSLAQGQGRCSGAQGHRHCSGPRLPAVAVQGADHRLWYYWLTTAGWHRHEVLAGGQDYSAPSLVIRSAGQAAAAEGTGTADIAAEGPAQELYYLVSADGGLRWTGTAPASLSPAWLWRLRR